MNEDQTKPDGGSGTEEDTLSSADKRRIAEQIGRQLRGMYDGLLNQPLPDRLMDLVKQLEGGTGDRKREQ